MKKEKVFEMPFSKVYPLLVAKAERKNRSRDDVNQIIFWLTGYDENQLNDIREKEITYREFFDKAPILNPNANKIKGVVCGIRVEDIDDPLMQKIRYLDKLIDELARGKNMENILRS
ncbi:DUF2200 domain-containing protein [Peptoniphilus sp.]|jgi:hypothetical protein|uniref:DUF2200 domain-containing protein n=1 Tax=Peptoniphilus sp. TaxID=1971214 RepID=UPI003D8EB72B